MKKNVILNEVKNLVYTKQLISISLFMLLCVLTGCEHRPLVEQDDPNRRRVRVYLDENIRNVSFGFYNESLPKPLYRTPEVMRVVLFSSTSDHVVSEAYIQERGTDDRGNYLEGVITVPPGNYRLLAYNFDTESVHVGDEYSYEVMFAYTNSISTELYSGLGNVWSTYSEADWRIVYEPDHFFVESEKTVVVEENTDVLSPADKPYFVASSSVKSYYLQVEITGAELVSSAVALLSGMAGSVKVSNQSMIENDPAIVYFSLQKGVDKEYPEKAVAYTTFTTFGKLEEQENYLSLTFEFYIKNGQTYTETIPLTDLFDTELVKVNQWLLIDKVIAIDGDLEIEGNGGGMSPDVGEWDNEEGEIYL